MSAIYDFYGKNVTEAIENARQQLGVEHEQLEIDIVSTGSAGIFGFAKKDAHIRVVVKQQPKEDVNDPYGVSDIFAESLTAAGNGKKSGPEKPAADPVIKENGEIAAPAASADEEEQQEELQPAEVALLEKELAEIVRLMGFTATVTTTVTGRSVTLTLHGDYEQELIGEDGKVLDSLQYLLRKIAGRKIAGGGVRLTLDVGDYRVRRLAEMKALATELAERVRKDGKTQAIPALNPAERREIHILLQEDNEVRSRSVGDGMFKKVLIYKSGSGGKRGRRPSRNRKSASYTPKESA